MSAQIISLGSSSIPYADEVCELNGIHLWSTIFEQEVLLDEAKHLVYMADIAIAHCSNRRVQVLEVKADGHQIYDGGSDQAFIAQEVRLRRHGSVDVLMPKLCIACIKGLPLGRFANQIPEFTVVVDPT